MENSKILYQLIFMFPFFVLSYTPANSQSVYGKWSGTFHVLETLDGQGIKSTRQGILTINENEVTGSVIEVDEMTVNGKLVCKSTCSGTGKGQLYEVTLDRDLGTYRIHAMTPPYECNTQGPYCEFPEIKKDEFDIITNEHPLGRDQNVLAGTDSTEGETGAGYFKAVRTWVLRRVLDIDLIITPVNYDNWLPEPGKDEETIGNAITVNLKVQGRNGNPPAMKAKKFILNLSRTSREPGITLNMPMKDPKTTPDLKFIWQINADTSNEAQKMEIRCNTPCVTSSFKIGSYDGGGYTTLTATAILEDETEIKGTLLIPGSEEQVLIPKRDLTSNIGIKWLNENANPGEQDDKEKTAGNGNDGDGLSAYEEYRGVIAATEFSGHPAKFGRLDPSRKELGICMKKSDITYFQEGVNWLQSATDFKVVRFQDTEIDTTVRRLNINFKTSNVHPQYVLRLVREILPENVGGFTYGGGGPSTTPRVAVDETQLQSAFQTYVIEARPHQLRFTLSEFRAQTIAHELSHGLNVEHHGVESLIPDQNAFASSRPPYRIFRINSNVPVTLSDVPFRLERIGETNTFESGDLSCMMIYNPWHKWAFSRGVDGALIFNEMPMLPMGRKLCTSERGTGVNAINGYLGSTYRPRGNCMSQLNIKL